MTTIRLAWLELARFRGPLPRLVPVALALIPLLYGAIYLWSNWDPYGRLDQVPVAVVNQDRAVQFQGQTVDAGRLFVQQLQRKRVFDWRFVDARAASAGLHDGTYYFTITVPPDFSANLTSGVSATPQRAAMLIRLNDANGYIVGKMAESAGTTLQNQIDTAAYSAYVQAVLGSLATLHDRLGEAAAGARSLQQGAQRAEQASGQLASGLDQLNAGAGQLAAANRQIADAVVQVNQVVQTAAGVIADQLPAATQTLVNAATAIDQASGAIADVTAQGKERAGAVVADLQDLEQRYPDLAQDQVFQAAKGAAQDAASMADRASALALGAKGVADQNLQLAQQLQADTGAIQQRVRGGAAKSQQLADGARRASQGADQLKSGLNTATGGAHQLHGGLGTLSEGTVTLAGGLGPAAQQVPSLDPAQRARAASVLGSPVDVRTTIDNPARVYGRGMAPFFFAIALWVFGMIAFMLLRPLNLRALAGRASDVTVALAGLLPATAIGVVGGWVLYAVAWIALGLSPSHPLEMAGLIALAAACFVALNHLLRVVGGLVGGAVGLVLLMLQLAGCGGLYPVPTTPPFFQAIHPFLPMSYLVDSLRITISGGAPEHLLRDALVLAGVLVATLIVTSLAVHHRREFSMMTLKPALEA